LATKKFRYRLKHPALASAEPRDVMDATGSQQSSPLEWQSPSTRDPVVPNRGESLLASIATCLLLQASILGAGWLLEGVSTRQEALRGEAFRPQPGLAGAIVKVQA
jgi:hypothetical protein